MTKPVTYLRVELDLAQVELRLGDEEPAEGVLGQELDDEAERVGVGVVLDTVLDCDGEYVAEDALAGVAARLNSEVDHGYGGTFVQVPVVVSEYGLEPLLGDGPVGGAARLLFALGHGGRGGGFRRLCPWRGRRSATDFAAPGPGEGRLCGATEGRGGRVRNGGWIRTRKAHTRG
jgi:hypothetical protein